MRIKIKIQANLRSLPSLLVYLVWLCVITNLTKLLARVNDSCAVCNRRAAGYKARGEMRRADVDFEPETGGIPLNSDPKVY